MMSENNRQESGDNVLRAYPLKWKKIKYWKRGLLCGIIVSPFIILLIYAIIVGEDFPEKKYYVMSLFIGSVLGFIPYLITRHTPIKKLRQSEFIDYNPFPNESHHPTSLLKNEFKQRRIPYKWKKHWSIEIIDLNLHKVRIIVGGNPSGGTRIIVVPAKSTKATNVIKNIIESAMAQLYSYKKW